MPASELTNKITVDDVKNWDNQHVIHPWSSLSPDDPNLGVIAASSGIHMVDDEGKRYIDGPGGMWCVNVGHGRTEIAEAMAEQAKQLTYVSPWTSATQPPAVLAHRLAEVSPGDLNTVFFTTGGSSAVDTALRFVHFYNNVKGRPKKKTIIAREKGYHGSTYLAASVSGKERDRKFIDTNSDFVRFLPDVNPYIRPAGMSVEAWRDEKLADLENMIIKTGADHVAAFIAEPILSSGGVIVPPEGYQKGCLEICRKYDVLYISDEVVTGFGRLGHWFASENVFGIVPDIITCAKGLTSGYVPMGAALFSDRLLDEIKHDDHADILFSNGFTYSGHPVSAAAALKNMDIIEDENLLQHVRDISPHFQSRLRHLGEKYRIIGDARGIGLMGCLEGSALPDSPEEERLSIDYEFGHRMDEATEKRGLLVRPLINMCVFSPPLIITIKEVDIMFDILDESIAEVEAVMLS
jgi:adenosylmethionine-8-amino-7-oxononanoate aminotransferase